VSGPSERPKSARRGRRVGEHLDAARRAAVDLRRLVDRDAPRVYSVLLRDREDRRHHQKGARRVFEDAKLLLASLSEKLSPPRRALFVAALVSAGLALLDLDLGFGDGEYQLSFSNPRLLFLFSTLSLLFLLGAELVDRVLVRDEVEVARELQAALLPHAPPSLAGWSVASDWATANDIGGDYHRYEALEDGRIAVVVADASGHGMAAGLLMAVTDTALRIAIEQDPAPDAVARLLHRVLKRTGDRRAFVTLFYGLLDPSSGRVDAVSAGHPSPVVRRVSGELEEPAAGSLPLGIVSNPEPWTGTIELAPGDLLVLSTDGVFEAADESGATFGWPGLRGAVAAGDTAPAATIARIRNALDRHVRGGALSDDYTVVAIRRDPVA